MAYNPFNIFRRNQKALFAVLTVFIMFMFTLSSGVQNGDFFETFGRWLGASKGEVVCTIDGHRITSRDLSGGTRGLEFRRLIANRFMYNAADEAIRELRATASQMRDKLSPQGQKMADAMERIFLEMLQGPLDQQSAMMARFDPAGYERKRQEDVSRAIQFTEYVSDAPGKEEDKAAARAYRTALILTRMLREAPRDQYFVNAPNKTRADLIDFLLWAKKADQLGIRFSRDDVKRLIQQDFFNSFRSDVQVRKRLQEMTGFTMELCLDALADEFRVRAAQEAVLGPGARYHRAPLLTTPYEAFEFYRDQCSPTTYKALAVPVAAYLDRVTGEPTEAELKELYDKYASDEPNPKNETPGFKTPRRIEVAFIGLTGEEPYYKKLAEEQIKFGEVMAQASGALTVPVPGVGPEWLAGLAGPLSLKAPAVDAAYAAKVKEFDFQRQQNYEKSSLTPRSRFSSLEADDPILPTNAVRPGVVAATLGAMIGQTAGGGSPGAAVALAMAAPLAYEQRQRVAIGMPLVLGACPSPALFPTLIGGAVAYRVREPKPLPIEALRPELLKETIDKRAHVLAFGDRRPIGPGTEPEKGDVARFTDELKKLSEDGRPKDRAAVEKYVKDFIATRGLTTFGKSLAPHDEWTLEDDPGLAPLVAAQRMSLLLSRGPHGGEYMPFGRSFFWTTDFDRETFTPRRVPSSGLFAAETYPPQEPDSRSGQMRYVVWRTEDLAPKKVDRLAARAALKAAWKRIKARELALKEANALADKIRASTGTNDVALERLLSDLYFDLVRDVKDPKLVARVKEFTIDNVAPLVMRPGKFGQLELGRFGLAESNDIPYPTPEMATALVENRDKGFKTVLVLPDAPKDTFYVTVLMKRELKRTDEFQRDVVSPLGTARDVLELYRAETIKRARDTVLELLKKEFKYEVTDEQKKKLEESTKSGSRDD
jgi:hypothetical protein